MSTLPAAIINVRENALEKIDLRAANQRDAMRRPQPIRVAFTTETDVEMKLMAPSPELPDDTEINDVLLPIRIAVLLNKAGFRKVGEIRRASDTQLQKFPRMGPYVAYLRKTLGGPYIEADLAVPRPDTDEEGK